MDYDSGLHETRTNAEHSETADDFRVSFESRDDLYFIQIEPGPVKIGRTADIRQRISTIQCASPYKVTLLASISGGGKYERKIHHHLREVRIRGEWFRWANIVSDLVECVKGGGDWDALLTDFDAPPPIADDDWRIGSPLYQGNPKYPQFQLPNPEGSIHEGQ